MRDVIKIRQLKSLTRLRKLERDKSAKNLAAVSAELAQAKEIMMVSESRYQLIVEMQRNIRQTGRLINPLYYNHQFEAGDVAKEIMDSSIAEWRDVRDRRAVLLGEFALQHCKLDVSSSATSFAIDEYKKYQERQSMDDCYDQQAGIEQQGGR